MLSGYLDQVLTQEEAQRVRVHLEDCGSCRTLVEELKTMRNVAMTSEFRVPSDDQWDERPRGAASGVAFGVGWLILIVWAVGVAGFALGCVWQGTESLLEKLIVFGGASGGVLLFVSVLIDRLRIRKTDRYRRVSK
jgi:anti-sigma factor RsiW